MRNAKVKNIITIAIVVFSSLVSHQMVAKVNVVMQHLFEQFQQLDCKIAARLHLTFHLFL